MSDSEKLRTGQCDDLKDKRAVVTGAGSGLGRSIAAGLSRAGARVGLFDIDGKSAGETEAIIKKELPQTEAAAMTCDVTDEADVEKAFEALLKKWGGLDILVNAAGVAPAYRLDGDFEVGYDDNGSVIEKFTWDVKGTPNDGSDDTEIERVLYEYNLQNRLAKVSVSTDGGQTWDSITEYKYDPSGNRVEKNVDGTVTDYLIDAYNHTGYAQVFVEKPDGGDNTTNTTYVIGDDVIAQATGNAPNAPKYLLYDGHGSTRQLSDSTGSPISNESYSYDAYGVLLGGPRTTQTDLLYAGEMYDSVTDAYYLRARYYSPSTGRFNRMDPFAGSPQDPRSLHKYLYCHANPVNSIDPTGRFTLPQLVLALALIAFVGGLILIGIFGELKKKHEKGLKEWAKNVSDDDFIIAVNGFQEATKNIPAAVHETDPMPKDWDSWKTACEKNDAWTIGIGWRGHIDKKRPKGEQRIVNYFEHSNWMLKHGDIVSEYPARIQRGGYAFQQGYGEILRMNIVIKECREEIRRRAEEDENPGLKDRLDPWTPLDAFDAIFGFGQSQQ